MVFSGDATHPLYSRGVFLSTHLHDPCLGGRGHDLSKKDNVMGLRLSEVHGQVVAHIRSGVGVVVPLYVLLVIRGGCLPYFFYARGSNI